MLSNLATKQAEAKAAFLEHSDNPALWGETHFRIPETRDQRLALAPYQKVTLARSQERDSAGNLIYSTVIWSDIKKAIKSTIAGMMALWKASTTEWASVYIIANDLKQADSRVAYYVRRAIELNPEMKRRIKVKSYKYTFPNHSFIECVPIDPAGESGGNADLLIFSELWAWKHDAAKRMWSEATLSPTKFGQSQRWVETYAGFDGGSPVLQPLYEMGVKQGQRLDDDLELYANGSILALWNTQPRHSWQTPEYYQSEAQILHPSELDRMHRNKWTAPKEAFVPKEWWDNCRGDVPETAPKEMWVIALDAAVSGDCFAIVACSRVGDKVYVRYCQIWKPPLGGKIDYEPIEEELLRLCKEHVIARVVYDETQLHDMTNRLRKKAVASFAKFDQGKAREIADKDLYDNIRDRSIIHSGEPDLSEHVNNAAAEIDKKESKLRIVKRSNDKKIDAAVALSMAAYTARYLWIG